MAEYTWFDSLKKDANFFEKIPKPIKEYWPPGKAVRELTFYDKLNENGDFEDETNLSNDNNDFLFVLIKY